MKPSNIKVENIHRYIYIICERNQHNGEFGQSRDCHKKMTLAPKHASNKNPQFFTYLYENLSKQQVILLKSGANLDTLCIFY